MVQAGVCGSRVVVLRPPHTGPVSQPYRGAVRDPSVEVWLLKADGTHLPPTAYKCDPGSASTPPPDRIFEISYSYPVAEGESAVAVAIRVQDDFYIEKLQPLAAAQ